MINNQQTIRSASVSWVSLTCPVLVSGLVDLQLKGGGVVGSLQQQICMKAFISRDPVKLSEDFPLTVELTGDIPIEVGAYQPHLS